MPSPDDFREEAARALPPPHEQERASLRADIVDELADHLACAYRRELLRTQGDTGQSLKNVHARFGNPRAIARKLWFDAMKGRLMAQKLMVAATLASALFIGLLAFAGWRYLESNRQMTSALIEKTQEANAALLAQTEKNQAALLARLEALPTAPAKAESLEWRSITLKLLDEKTGQPATNAIVSIIGPIAEGSNFKQEMNSVHPDEDGIIKLSPAYVGQYSVTITLPSTLTWSDAIMVRPGHDLERTFHVASDIQFGSLELNVDWPERLRGRDMWYIVGATQTATASVVESPFRSAPIPRLFAIHTDGRIVDLMEYYSEILPTPDGVAGYPPSDARELLALGKRAARWIGQPPGLHRIANGTLEFNMVGLYPHAELPLNINELTAELLGSTIKIDAGSYDQPTFGPLFPFAPQRPRTPKAVRVSYEHFGIPSIALDGQNNVTLPITKGVNLAIEDLMLPPIAPVEARRPRQISPFDPFHAPSKDGFGAVPSYSDPRSADVPSGANSTPLTVKCLTKTGSKPLPGVIVEIGIPSSNGPFNSLQQLITNAAGQADFDEVPSNAYLSRITLPWGEMKTLAGPLPQWDATSQKRVALIQCPDGPPAREKHAYQIKWPTPGKLDDHSPWLVMEVRANYERRVDSTKWISSEDYILAIHPDGLARAWKIQANQSGQSVTAMLHNMRRRGHIDTSWESLRPFLSPTEITPYYSPDFVKGSQLRVTGYGLATWDGSGDPISLLQGIQDGRYQHGTGSLFHDFLRTQVSMKSYRGSQLIPQETPARGEKMPTLSFEIPKDLYQSALRRAESLAETSGPKS